MNMPGFTAEASLYKIDERYHGILIAPTEGLQVLPQLIDPYPLELCNWVCFEGWNGGRWCEYDCPEIKWDPQLPYQQRV